jgi:hypothetical protein
MATEQVTKRIQEFLDSLPSNLTIVALRLAWFNASEEQRERFLQIIREEGY